MEIPNFKDFAQRSKELDESKICRKSIHWPGEVIIWCNKLKGHESMCMHSDKHERKIEIYNRTAADIWRETAMGIAVVDLSDDYMQLIFARVYRKIMEAV